MPLAFSGPRVRAEAVHGAKHLDLPGRTIVVNLAMSPAYLANEPRTPIPGLCSTVAVDTRLEQADHAVLLRVDEAYHMSDIVQEPGWQHFADINGAFPRSTGLWRSPQDWAGTVELDAGALLDGPAPRRGPQPFEVRLMLWYSPAGTDCGIHNEHAFIETHAQVSGIGRMQKFTTDDFGSLYEDVPMSPGYATPTPFCAHAADGSFAYPWHQYRADTDCVWLAVEYHPAS